MIIVCGGVSDMFKQFLNGAIDKYKKLQEENSRYQALLAKCFLLPKFYSYPLVDREKLTISYQLLMNLCPDLNEKDAVILRSVIPIDEICLSCLYAIECKSSVKFYFVATTKYLWLINIDGYLKYCYSDLSLTVVKNGLLSKTLSISNMLFDVNGTSDSIVLFIKLLQDATYRENLIQQKLLMFCDTIPCVFYLNNIDSGISIGKNYEVVFHTKTFHYKYSISDIKNYELLLDDMVIREKKSNRRVRITANKNSCYEMVLRITTNEREFVLPILEKSAFVSLYSSTSVEFMESKKFANKLVDLLDNMDEKFLNGELKKL